MSDAAELRRRLNRLGRAPGRRSPQPAGRRPGALPEGEQIDTPSGPAYRMETTYPADHRHGSGALGEVLEFGPSLAGQVAGAPSEGLSPLQAWTFLDLETTGLAGGAGTLSFLVGLGAFVGGRFRLRQYLLRDPAEEAAMLYALQEDLDQAAGFVTFNGRAFDMPLLEMRYLLGLRRRWRLTAQPQLDLLFPSRRLWRRGLPDCRLGTLEEEVLGVRRAEEDVPGAEVPGIYQDYLRTGDPSELGRVIYHNAQDILSLVGLAAAVLRRHQEHDLESLTGEEALAMARWHQSRGRRRTADQAFRAADQAFQEGTRGELHVELLRSYAAHLKRAGRRDEAVERWLDWYAQAVDDPRPCVELSKYYEWHAADLPAAHHWAQEALLAVSRWPSGWRRDRARAEIEHRLQRLERKLTG